jgi:hypothetical protein
MLVPGGCDKTTECQNVKTTRPVSGRNWQCWSAVGWGTAEFPQLGKSARQSPPIPPTLLEKVSNWIPPSQRSNHGKNGGSLCRKSEVNDLLGGVGVVDVGMKRSACRFDRLSSEMKLDSSIGPSFANHAKPL